VTSESEPVSFLGRRPPAGVSVRAVVLMPAEAVDYLREEWAEALVVVERGTLEVECRSGVRARFGSGALLTFATVEPRRLINPGLTPLVLSALTR